MTVRPDTGTSMLTRRTLTRGAAWGVPTVLVGAAAPAFAASGTTVQNHGSAGDQYVYAGASKCSSQFDQTAQMTIDSSLGSPAGITWTGTTGGTTITSVTLAIWLSDKYWTFASNNACWSALTYSSTIPTKTYNGYTYYGYTASYTCTISPTSPSTNIGWKWTSTNTCVSLASDPYFYVSTSSIVSGTTMSTDSGFVHMS